MTGPVANLSPTEPEATLLRPLNQPRSGRTNGRSIFDVTIRTVFVRTGNGEIFGIIKSEKGSKRNKGRSAHNMK